MLPKIVSYARGAFAGLKPEARQEAIQNVVANSCAAVAGLARRGKLDLCYPTVLAQYGIKQTRDFRLVGNKLNIRDVMSKYCQARKGVAVQRLDKYDETEQEWMEAVVEDPHTPVFEQAQFRVDFPAWLQTLKPRDRKVARFLSRGERTGDAARKFGTSEGRISQLRRELAESWRRFVGDEPGPAAVAA
jgi:hypothetical protein